MRPPSIIEGVIDLEEFVLCEHLREPDQCPLCAPVEREARELWREEVLAHAFELEVPASLAGVPFS